MITVSQKFLGFIPGMFLFVVMTNIGHMALGEYFIHSFLSAFFVVSTNWLKQYASRKLDQWKERRNNPTNKK